MIALWPPVIPARSPSGRNSTARPWRTWPGGWMRPGCQREMTARWERGVPGGWLADLIADWRAFDPLRLQARLDQLTHLRAEVGGIAVHLVYAPGSGPDPLPLLLTHGWPSSFLEYLDLLPLLTDPGGHGGPGSRRVHRRGAVTARIRVLRAPAGRRADP